MVRYFSVCFFPTQHHVRKGLASPLCTNVGSINHGNHDPEKTDRTLEMRSRALKGPSTQNYLLLALVVPEITLLGQSCGLGHHL